MNNRYMMPLMLLGVIATISDTLSMGHGKRLTTEDSSTYEQPLSPKREKGEVGTEPEQLTQEAINGLQERELRKHLKRAFSVYSKVSDSKRYNENQRTSLFLAGVNRNLLVNNIPDKLHEKIYPSVVAIQLESIEPLIKLQMAEKNNFSSFGDNGTINGVDPDKKYTNDHASTPMAKLDAMIRLAKNRGEDATRLKAKRDLLAYFRTYLDDLYMDASLAVLPQGFAKPNNSLVRLCARKVFTEWLHNDKSATVLNEFIENATLCTSDKAAEQEAHKNSPYQKSLKAIHRFFSFFSPKQVKQLSLAECEALHDYWAQELADNTHEDFDTPPEELPEDRQELIRSAKNVGFTNDEDVELFQIHSFPIFQKLNEKLGYFKKDDSQQG